MAWSPVTRRRFLAAGLIVALPRARPATKKPRPRPPAAVDWVPTSLWHPVDAWGPHA